MSRLTWAKRFTIAAATIALAGATMAPASAIPSEDKALFSQGHTDSPKAYWENNGLTLKASGQQLTALEEGIHWLHQGHNDDGKQYFYYTVPEGDMLSFLGEPDSHLYLGSPVNATGGASNLWIGYGADAAVPVEKFRDKTFQLELVDFEGPGRMEMFREPFEGDPPERFISSHLNDYRFIQLTAGAHSHISTTFTKPGSYTLTYRTSYRDATTGKFVASEPQKMFWQVGGSDPSKAELENVIEAYNDSKAEGSSKSFTHTFTLSPTDTEDPMTALTFDTGDKKATGTVAFYIDGHYLAQASLSEGKATWHEMIGSLESTFQAVYVPAADSPAPRWITAPVHYTHGKEATSTDKSGEFPTPAESDTPEHHLDPVNVTSKNFTITNELKGDNYVITAMPEDRNIEFTLSGGFGQDLTDTTNCPVNFTSTRSSRTMTLPKEYFEETCTQGHAIWKVTPATQYDAGQTTFEIDADNATFSGKGTFSSQGDNGSSADSEDQNPTDKATNDSKDKSDNQDMTVLNEKVTINDGHLDYGPIAMPDGTLRVIVGDDSRTHAKKTVLRDPDAVTLTATINDHARSKRVFGDKSYNFLGELGTALFVLPQTKADGLVWPGFSTERLSTSTFPKGTTLKIKATSTPEGGKAWAFTSGLTELQNLLVDSTKSEGTTITNAGPAHIHANWVFTKPGTYEFSIQASATNKDGTSVTSQPGTIRFVINDKTPGKVEKTDEANTTPDKSNSKNSHTGGTDPNGSGTTTNGKASTGTQNAKATPKVEQCIPTPIEKEVAAPAAKSAGGSYTVPANTHAHPNWVFTKPGTYKVTLTQTATLKNGKRAQATGTLTFNVGGSGNANSGHFDIGSILEGDNLYVKVKDDRNQPAKWVDPNTLIFGLGPASKAKAPAGIDFIAPAGSDIWMISSSQVANVPWVGANTQHPSIVSGTTGTVKWTLSNVSGPGKLAVFSSGNLGQVVGTRWFGGASGSAGQLPPGVEKKNGKYFKTEWVGKTPSGKDCQLSPEQIAKLKAEGKHVASSQVKALKHTGATVSTLAGFSVVLLGAGIALAIRKRRA
ncbi:choice-of-anchor M domain-containing protein [Trueperella pecoris]|uniref:choice-of-anchor M domain-containing protein n=1 Tax=Trueperella pecoris TaxID=2733571 RepID=UPI00186B761C|nr:choice-of-anchor M domain-containing protein [Trueperella pecoris]QOQ38673.1 hypothetical protein HLG82_03895 [Trueperella pecoris]